MKRAARQIATLALILLMICVVSRLAMRNTYTAYIPVPNGAKDAAPQVRLIPGTPGVIAQGEASRVDDYIRVRIQPRREGETWVNARDEENHFIGSYHFRVGRFGTIYEAKTGGFTGDTIALAASVAFWLSVAAIMFHAYRHTGWPEFYSYSTIYAAGFSLFSLLTGLTLLYITVLHVTNPDDYVMLSAYDAISTSGFRFMMLTAPLMLLFAAAMAVSNVALIRHEGFAPKNALGIGVGVVLVAGEVLAYFMFVNDFKGAQWAMRMQNTLNNVYATAFAYFECVLVGAIICGVKAARHVPAGDRDYILILGCKFRRDGTLTPLLRGRVDRAVAYWKAQRARTGVEAVLMPTGGQGSDEAMSEAEAMRRYLLSQGVPERAIRIEDRSRNTYQNMEYSKALIDRDAPRARVAYATTNYHVFRSGVWASLAGLQAEGMGSGTKWWYWPNAFMRECVGLLMNHIRQELLVLVVMIAFFGALTLALG